MQWASVFAPFRTATIIETSIAAAESGIRVLADRIRHLPREFPGGIEGHRTGSWGALNDEFGRSMSRVGSPGRTIDSKALLLEDPATLAPKGVNLRALCLIVAIPAGQLTANLQASGFTAVTRSRGAHGRPLSRFAPRWLGVPQGIVEGCARRRHRDITVPPLSERPKHRDNDATESLVGVPRTTLRPARYWPVNVRATMRRRHARRRLGGLRPAIWVVRWASEGHTSPPADQRCCPDPQRREWTAAASERQPRSPTRRTDRPASRSPEDRRSAHPLLRPNAARRWARYAPQSTAAAPSGHSCQPSGASFDKPERGGKTPVAARPSVLR